MVALSVLANVAVAVVEVLLAQDVAVRLVASRRRLLPLSQVLVAVVVDMGQAQCWCELLCELVLPPAAEFVVVVDCIAVAGCIAVAD